MLFKACVLWNLLLNLGKLNIAKMHLFFKMASHVYMLCCTICCTVVKNEDGHQAPFSGIWEVKMANRTFDDHGAHFGTCETVCRFA